MLNRVTEGSKIAQLASTHIDIPSQQYANAEESTFGTHYNCLVNRINRTYAPLELQRREYHMNKKDPFVGTAQWQDISAHKDVSVPTIFAKCKPIYQTKSQNDYTYGNNYKLDIYRTRQNLDILTSGNKMFGQSEQYVPGDDPFGVAALMRQDIFNNRGRVGGL